MWWGRKTSAPASAAAPAGALRSWRGPPPRSAADAQAFLDETQFTWFQRFQLAPDVWTPGGHDVEFVLDTAGLTDLKGKSVLDIGTSNAGAAFEAERRGAARVLATDIYPASWFGVDRLREFLGSSIEFRQGSVYDLDGLRGGEQFDVVLFDGLLYHLRHPVLGLDNVWRAVKLGGMFVLETAVCDAEVDASLRVARFYRKDELGADGSNWFAPTTSALLDWCLSAGFEAEVVGAWPESGPSRALVLGTKTTTTPEYVTVSYEREKPLRGVPAPPEPMRSEDGALRVGEQFPPPDAPWTPMYSQMHQRFVASMLANREIGRVFAQRRELPREYGIGLDERVIEFPWLLAAEPRGRVLDAGSSLNHAHILDAFLPMFDSLTIVTLEPEQMSYPERHVSYVYADLRELPFRDGAFDTVVCISTLQHIGMDNSFYGSAVARAEDPEPEMRRALDELVRVLAPHGRILITVPYGVRQDEGEFRQFDETDVSSLTEAMAMRSVEVAVYQYTARGWRLSDLGSAAGSVYRNYLRDPTPVADRAAAARAVACICGGGSAVTRPAQQ